MACSALQLISTQRTTVRELKCEDHQPDYDRCERESLGEPEEASWSRLQTRARFCLRREARAGDADHCEIRHAFDRADGAEGSRGQATARRFECEFTVEDDCRREHSTSPIQRQFFVRLARKPTRQLWSSVQPCFYRRRCERMDARDGAE